MAGKPTSAGTMLLIIFVIVVIVVVLGNTLF